MQVTSITKVDNIPAGRQRLLKALEEGTYDTISALCEAAEVTRQTYYDAIQDEKFVKALFQSSTGQIYAAIPHIMTKIVKQAKQGSFAHQKMLLEMVRLYQGDRPQVNINVIPIVGGLSVSTDERYQEDTETPQAD